MIEENETRVTVESAQTYMAPPRAYLVEEAALFVTKVDVSRTVVEDMAEMAPPYALHLRAEANDWSIEEEVRLTAEESSAWTAPP